MIVVLDMQDRRPAWAMPEWVPDRLRDALDRTGGGELRVVDVPADGSGDGTARADPAVLEALVDAEAYFGFGVAPEVVRAGRRLRWVHTGAAGVGGSLSPELRRAGVVFTNSAGIHGPPIAETVLGMILFFFRGLDVALDGQRRGVWDTSGFYETPGRVRELATSTVGVMGLGGVGREVARRASAMGARVVGTRRSARRDGTVRLDGRAGGDPGPEIEIFGGPGAPARMAEVSDALVVTLPRTPETEGLVDSRVLARLPDGAVVVNVARGGVLDEAALRSELEAGRLRGAGLDVFAEEPLPAGDPLWTTPNVLITPHVSAVTTEYWEREAALVTENIERFRAGRRLRNEVDLEAGY